MSNFNLRDIPKKRPLTALLMAEDFLSPIQNGEKTITIRDGWRDYHVGEKVVLCRCADMSPMEEGAADYGWAIMAKITSVKYTTLKEVSESDLNDDGFSTLEDAILSLGSYYADISEESFVTVIRWELL